MATTQVAFSCEKPAKIVKWKVSPGTMVSPGKVLLLYKTVSTDNDDSSNHEEKLRAKTERGLVAKFLAKPNEIVQPGQGILLLEACKHNTVMIDLCADCGVDLRAEGVDAPQASISMVHSIPELKVCPELAQQIGKEDEERLLRDKKLALLVDLDQTIVHTTNDDVDPNIKDVYHYKLPSQRSQWYHTRLRPHTRDFLTEMSKLYELHICTFGVREYAHTVAALLDKKGDLFSHRILSRNECFDPGSKYPNLKALFPCGDEMVCIIDDREDVWQGCKNLVQVKPYFFFQHSANIHAPPGMNKVDDPSKSEMFEAGEMAEENEDDKNGVTEETPQEQDEKTSNNTETLSKVDEEDKSLPKVDNTETSSKVDKEDKSLPKVDNTETSSKVDKEDKSLPKVDNTEDEKTETKTDSDKVADVKSDEVTSDKTKTETTDEAVTDDSTNKSPVNENEEGTYGKKMTNLIEEAETKVEVECEDQDDYLLYLEDILRRIHKEYYTDIEEKKERRSLTDIIPKVRARVLQGATLTFSGLIPIHQKLYQSRAYKAAVAFGAKVTQDLTDETTHLVAMKPGTQKVNTAKKRGNIKIVNPEWLWTCAERWEHVDERLYTLTTKSRGSRIPPPHCSNPEPSRKREKGRKGEPQLNSFADTINPLYFVSQEEINDMDKEVEEDMNDLEIDPSMDEPNDETDESETIGLKRVLESSDSDSVEEMMVNPAKRMKEDEESSDEDDEDPDVRFNKGEDMYESLDLGDISQDSVEIGDTEDYEDDREWNAMGAALEREFLSE